MTTRTSSSRGQGGRRTAVAAGVLAIAVVAGTTCAEDASVAPPPPGRPVVIGQEYQAGSVHRWLWGDDYRSLWTTPTRVEPLDLHAVAGGLAPVKTVGGRETKALALRGADGRSYTFRAIDKDPASILPEELRDTWARDLVQDQIAANQPAAFFVADELMNAAGILHSSQRLVVMPDDPALGEFRKEFAGLAGQFYEFPTGPTGDGPGFHGALEILDHQAFYKRIASDARERADARAFLKARLLDVLIGDWDRHRDQWRWAKFADRPEWVPIPDDRDQAFSRYEGLVLDLARPRVPILQRYGRSYPSMKGLTWNGWEQDRQLLAGLERPVWVEVATELRNQITGDVIERAARRMPPEYFRIDGPRLIRDLTGRRDALVEAANAFYEHLADKVKVYLTDDSESVEVRRLDGGDTLVQAWRVDAYGRPVGDPVYRRVLHPRETSEVQIYTRAGADRIVSIGRPNGIQVRAIGGSGNLIVDDTKGGGTELSDSAQGQIERGAGSRHDRRTYTPPAPPTDAPWIPPRDWGRDTFIVPWVGYGTDVGALIGAGIDTRAFGFRKDPYSSRHVLRAAFATGDSTYRVDYRAELRRENRSWYWGWDGYASGIESLRFYGFGNETVDNGDPNAKFFKARQQQFLLTPAITLPFAGAFTLALGPTVKYSSSTHKDDVTLINRTQPYGYGDFGEVGGTALLQLDTRGEAAATAGGKAFRSLGYPRSGALVQVRGQVFPGLWDVQDTFGSVKGSAAAYLSPHGQRAPTLALRVGGEKVFGNHPYFEAAYLGGGLGGYGLLAGDDPVRGLPHHRYAGDASVFGGADLRIYVSRFRLILPGTWGLLGFGDFGRVYVDGEDSNTWHHGYGAGLWFAWLDRANTISATYGRSEKRNAFYVRAGFAF
jgi:hypothetical protein